MNKVTKIIITSLVLMLPMSVFAKSFITEGVYAGGGIYKTDIDFGDEVEYDEVNFKFFAGKKIQENLAIEAHFLNLTKKDILNNSLEYFYNEGSSIGVSGLYSFNISSTVKPFARLGIHIWELEGTSRSYSLDIDEVDLFYGIGTDIDIDVQGIIVRVEYESYKLSNDHGDNDLISFGVSAIYQF